EGNDDAFCLVGLAGEAATGPDEPSTTREALAGEDADKWQEAMDKEMQGLWDKGTFDDDDAPPGRKPIKTQFVYEIKRAADGAVERYKARLVPKGFTQREGIDFFQTLSPVIGFDVIRTVLATAAHKAWDISLLDFTQAYLNAPLQEDIWLELPDGRIVKVRKAIYGLKQSALEWYKELR
ncbi:unnamed protein product, partial [Discosporangium mesarthrocarpum]